MSKVYNSMAWSFSERYLGLIINVGSTMVLSRLLSPHEVGIFSLCAAFVAVITILRDFGVSEFLIQEKELTQKKIQGAFAVALAVGWSFSAVVFASSGLVANYYAESGLQEILMVLSLNFLLLPLASPAFALLNREMAFQKVFVIQGISNFLQAATGIFLAYRGFSYMSLAWSSVVGIASQVVLVSLLRPRESFLWPSLSEANTVWAYGIRSCSARLIESLTNNYHEFFIGKLFGFGALGLFSRARGLIEMFYTAVTSAILRVVMPAFAADHRSGFAVDDSYLRGVVLFTAVAWPFFCFIAITAEEVIYVIFGAQWVSAAPIATILCGSAFISSTFALAPSLLSATGNINIRLRISAIVSPVQLICVGAASMLSLHAIAAAFVATSLLHGYLYAAEVNRLYGLSITGILKACTGSFLVAAVTSGVVILCFACINGSSDYSVITLAISTCAATLSWLATIYMLRHPISYEVTRLALAIIKRKSPTQENTEPKSTCDPISKIILLSPSDRFNYGDLLFPIIAKQEITKHAPLASVAVHALVKSNLVKYGALATNPLRSLFDKETLKPGDTIIFTGGGTVGVDWTYMRSNLLGKAGNRVLYYSKRLLGADIMDALCRQSFLVPTRFPWLAAPEDFPVPVKIAYNCIGGSELAKLSPKRQAHTLEILAKAAFVSVRDQETKRLFSPIEDSVCVALAPDSAIIMSEQFPVPWLIKHVSEEFLVSLDSAPYICFQANLSFSRKNKSQIVAALEALYEVYGLRTLLLPIGRYVGLDDQIALRSILQQLRTPAALISDEATIWEIMIAIARSRIFLGTSLHGNITAQSFAVRHLGLSGGPAKLEHYLSTWDLPEQAHCIPLDMLTEHAAYVLSVDQSELEKKRVELISRSHQNFVNMAQSCGLSWNSNINR